MKKAQVALGWVLVGGPLLYGITQTLMKVPALFG